MQKRDAAGMTSPNQLSQAEAFLDSLIENLPNMVFVKDAKDLRFVRFNKAGENLLGYSREELIGKNDFDLFPRDQAEFFTRKDRDVLNGNEIIDIAEEKISTRLNGDRILHTKKIPLFDREGKVQYLLGISEDITERIRASEEKMKLNREQALYDAAQKAIQLRDEFLSIASHELKTPITSLKLQLQLTRKLMGSQLTLPSPERLAKFLESSTSQVNRLSKLVEDLLDVSKIQAGKLALNFEPVDLGELLSEVLERFSEEFEEAGCQLIFEKENDVIGVWDRGRIEQVVMNLVSNALKYASGNPIQVRLMHTKSGVRFQVQDFGCGIPADKREQIFERFVRVTTSRSIGGLGLGLFIVSQIVQAHRGTIQVESELGKGSTFSVDLPLNSNP